MKQIALCAGFLIAMAAHAGSVNRAPLTGHHVSGSFAGKPLLICEYRGPEARFEILSDSGRCAPYLDLDVQ